MPTAALRYCSAPGCREKVASGRCPAHTSQEHQRRALHLGHRWYGTARWRRLRDEVRAAEPFCRMGCGRLTDQVDHIVPHRGDETRFFDRSNLQGLCAEHHGEKTRRGE